MPSRMTNIQFESYPCDDAVFDSQYILSHWLIVNGYRKMIQNLPAS